MWQGRVRCRLIKHSPHKISDSGTITWRVWVGIQLNRSSLTVVAMFYSGTFIQTNCHGHRLLGSLDKPDGNFGQVFIIWSEETWKETLTAGPAWFTISLPISALLRIGSAEQSFEWSSVIRRSASYKPWTRLDNWRYGHVEVGEVRKTHNKNVPSQREQTLCNKCSNTWEIF